MNSELDTFIIALDGPFQPCGLEVEFCHHDNKDFPCGRMMTATLTYPGSWRTHTAKSFNFKVDDFFELSNAIQYNGTLTSITITHTLLSNELFDFRLGCNSITHLTRYSRCLGYLLCGCEMNKTVESLFIHANATPVPDAPRPGLLLKNALFLKNLTSLTVDCSQHNVTSGESNLLAEAIKSMPQLHRLSLLDVSEFQGMEEEGNVVKISPIGTVISACVRVQELRVCSSSHISKCHISIAELLNKTDAKAKAVNIIDDWINLEEVVTIITGLQSNSTVESTHLLLPNTDSHFLSLVFCSVANMLCDVSSIESIRQSNHTLNHLSLIVRDYDNQYISSEFAFNDVLADNEDDAALFIKRCLKMNQNKNKEKVMQDKILRFYFRGNFDMSPFQSMKFSILPDLLSNINKIDRVDTTINTMFRLTKGTVHIWGV